LAKAVVGQSLLLQKTEPVAAINRLIADGPELNRIEKPRSRRVAGTSRTNLFFR